MQVFKGEVVSDSMEKTCVVLVSRRFKHPRWKKYITRSKKYLVHDEENDCRVGDYVSIASTRPLSKRKHFVIQNVITRAK